MLGNMPFVNAKQYKMLKKLRFRFVPFPCLVSFAYSLPRPLLILVQLRVNVSVIAFFYELKRLNGALSTVLNRNVSFNIFFYRIWSPFLMIFGSRSFNWLEGHMCFVIYPL